MTNPSTGLPEELEKIKQAAIPYPNSWGRDDIEQNQAVKKAADKLIRDVLDWACKKVCVPCSKGWPVVRSDDVNFPWIHPKMEGKIAATTCAASVLREGN